MNARNRKLLPLALGAMLATPAAFAQLVNGNVGARVGVGASARVPDPVPAVRSVAGQAREATRDTVRQAGRAAADARVRGEAKAEALIPPVQAQGAANAAAHASVVQRDLWGKLDTDRDGRISAVEADASADFDAGFEVMDSNHDGFITDAEYTAYAKANLSTGAAHAAGHAMPVVNQLWGRLDANADGRISTSEADVDAGFDGMFGAMDSDSDGFVTEAEYRTHAKAGRKPDANGKR